MGIESERLYVTPAEIAVPTKNSVDNTNIRDVIGNKTDDVDGNSVYSILHMLHEHVHSRQYVYPTLAAGVTVTAGAGAWQEGDFAEIIPVNTIAKKFDIHFVNVASTSAADTYELSLYAATTEIGRFRVTRGAGVNSVQPIFFMTAIQAANTQIQAKVASSSGGGDSAVISVFYHVY